MLINPSNFNKAADSSEKMNNIKTSITSTDNLFTLEKRIINEIMKLRVTEWETLIIRVWCLYKISLINKKQKQYGKYFYQLSNKLKMPEWLA